MEEKIYFKPANYGKGHKKVEKDKAKGKGNFRTLKLVSFLLFLFIIVVVIVWLLHGKTSTTGQYPENIKNESLTCTSTNKQYEKISSIDSTKKEIKLSMIFYGTEKLSSISLKYTLMYDSNQEAYSAEAVSHAQFNLGLQKAGYASGLFSNKFTLMDNILVVALHAEGKDINDLTREYFLINREDTVKTLNDYRLNYETKGFDCYSSIDDNMIKE